MKKVRLLSAGVLVALAIFAAAMLYLHRAAIFQRGNPVPYLIAAAQISESKPYVEVDEESGVYISMGGNCPELLDYFQEKTGMDFIEQVGGGYLFADDADTAVITSEVYWKYFTVWELPVFALAEKSVPCSVVTRKKAHIHPKRVCTALLTRLVTNKTKQTKLTVKSGALAENCNIVLVGERPVSACICCLYQNADI